MKEELIRVLNKKLDNIKSDIDSLKELNGKIDDESERLSFINKIIDIFKEHGEADPLNFAKINKDDFAKVLDITGEDVKNLFNSGSCNYDGLVYLIDGIKNGVSITLTNEQTNGIEYLIQCLDDKKTETEFSIEDFNHDKSKYEISDVNELSDKKDKYENVIEEIHKDEYIVDIDLLKEAIDYAELSPSEIIDILSYTLEYNANLYNKNKPVVEVKEEKHYEEEKVEEPEEDIDTSSNEFHFNQIENDNIFDQPHITFDEEKKEEVEEEKTEVDDNIITIEPFTHEESEVKEEYTPYEEPEEDYSDISFTPDYTPEEETKIEEEDNVEEPVSEIKPEDLMPTSYDIKAPVEEEKEDHDVEEAVDDDFKNVINEKADYDKEKEQEDKMTSTREMHKIFSKYGIEENVVLNELIDGDIDEYQKTLDSLNDHAVLDYFKKNKELLVETLLYSNNDIIDKVLKIIKEDLSVDDEDYEITLKIVVNTIPSIFINEGGNYNNFIKNVELFKDLEINLINLFDFSKEVLIADHDSIKNNLDIINKYDFDVNYKNAKYFLLIPNIADKLDYYIESVYEDKTKNEKFDGIEYIKEYAAKLNVVTDETIKRLRYASTSGNKVFGNKPGSLSGEITNLKVNALDLTDEYLNGFFNNEFANITSDEVREYTKLIHNSSNVGDYSDELDKLSSYRDGLRYNIEGILVSYNKVLRNYNILRSYGTDTKKALQFAVCYNLVITKDEYNKLNDLLEKIGGNA